MKNKILSAILLGMSASMAVPGTIVFAADESAESQTTEEAVIDTTENVDKLAEMESYANNEELKKADTPEGFADDVVALPFMIDVFGKYSDIIMDYISNGGMNTNSLYDCEMDIVSKAEELMAEESEDAIKAAKYNIALVFESKYGEAAFQAGRDVRRNIVSGKDAEFAECTSISEVDSVYVKYNGVTNIPVDYFTNESVDDIYEEPEATTNDVTDEQKEVVSEEDTLSTTSETSEDFLEKNVDEPSQSETLASYVEGIVDIEMVVGSEIPSPSVTFDSAYVQSVSLDSSAVDTATEGTYTVTYIITGSNNSTENVDMKCVVKNDNAIDTLRQEMCNKVDEMAKDKITEEGFIDEWSAKAEEAKSKIKTMTTEEEMQVVLDELQVTADDIIARQQLSVTKKGYVDIFNAYLKEFKFETEAEQSMANDIAKETIDNINNAKTVKEAADALQAGKDKISAIGSQEGNSIEQMKESAKEEVVALKDMVNDKTSMTENIYNLIITRIDECSTAKEIESLTNSANRVFADIKKGIDGDMLAMDSVYKDMKGFSSDSDSTSTIDLIIKKGTTKDLNDAEYRIKDICSAILMTVDEFKAYLFERAGEEVSGNSKTDAYSSFIDIMESGPSENELSEAKKSAKGEIESKLNEISGDAELELKKEALKKELFLTIDSATTVDEVQTNLADALQKVKALKEEVESVDSLKNKKEEAKAYFDKIVSEQSDDELRREIAKLAEQYSDAVDEAKTEDDINIQKEAFDNSVEAVIKAYNENKELASAMSNTIKKIMALTSNVNSQYVTTDMKSMINESIDNVKQAKTVEECNRIYTNIKDNFNRAYVESMRMSYELKLDTLLKNSNIKSEKYQEQAVSVIKKQKDNLKKSTNETAMENCYNLAKKQIDKIVELEKNEDKLNKAKEDAINRLKSEYPNPSDNETKILNSYVNKINDAKSQDEIDRLVKECKESITRSQQNGGTSSSTNDEIVKKREEVISALTNMYSEMEKNENISDTNKADAKNVLDSYIQQINEATTVEEIQSLFEKGKDALSKYGGNPNDAVPNTSTNTTAGSETPEAGEKESELMSTGKVKTGDSNIGILATAGVSIIAALGAAVLAIKRFLNKD